MTTNMETLRTIMEHRSIRRYKPDPIPEGLLNEILEAGLRASNTGNMQVYSIIVTQSHEVKEQLAPCHFNQPMVTEAPVVLTFCADIHRFGLWCQQRDARPGYDNLLWFCNAAIDAVLAAQNVCIAAEAHGLGICYLGTTLYTPLRIAQVLRLPQGVMPVTTVVMGHPAEQPELQDRLPMRGVVHCERYGAYSPNDIDAIYAAKERLPLTERLLVENKLQTLAQVFTERRYPHADNLAFSRGLLESLAQQGFMYHDDMHSGG